MGTVLRAAVIKQKRRNLQRVLMSHRPARKGAMAEDVKNVQLRVECAQGLLIRPLAVLGLFWAADYGLVIMAMASP